jgi:RNA-directed DNA polymerase
LTRDADDFVIQARYQGHRLKGWIEGQLEGCLGLVINREKTRTIQLKEEGATLDFLGYRFRYEEDLQGRPRRYLNLFPSKKSLEKEREKIRELTGPKQCFKPVREVIQEVNGQLAGWKNYFKVG